MIADEKLTAKCHGLVDAGLLPPIEIFITAQGWGYKTGAGKIIDGYREKKLAQVSALRYWMQSKWPDTLNF